MPLERILQGMLDRDGVEAVVFLDADGETILSCGSREPEKLRALGAYQGILLSVAARLGLANDQTIITLFEDRSILTHHIKDGYFISVIFRGISFGNLQFRLQETFRLLEKEL